MASTTLSMSEVTKPELIPAAQQYFINLWFFSVISPIAAMVCVVSTAINLLVFARQGLNERVNFSLFVLSLYEHLTAMFTLILFAFFAGITFNFQSDVNLLSLIEVVGWVRNLFSDLSSFMIVYISIETSLCVLIPFKFNAHLTFTKVKTIVLCIFVFVLLNYGPLLGSFQFVFGFHAETNKTVLALTYSEVNTRIIEVNDLLFGFTLPVLCQVSIVVCVIILHLKLQASARFRTTASNFRISREFSETPKTKTTQRLPKREKRVIRMVLLIACLYLPISLPQSILALGRMLAPDFATTDNYLYLLAGFTYVFLYTLHGSLSIFVYLKFNSSYRKTFESFFFKTRTYN